MRRGHLHHHHLCPEQRFRLMAGVKMEAVERGGKEQVNSNPKIATGLSGEVCDSYFYSYFHYAQTGKRSYLPLDWAGRPSKGCKCN